MPEPTFMAALGQQAASQAVNAGMGLILGGINDRRQLKQQDKLLKQQQGYDRQQMEYAQQLQYDMWQKTNYGAQMDQLKKAGLNPGLIYGMGGGGGATLGQTGGGTHANAAPTGGGEIMGLLQMRTQEAQIKLMEAQAEKTQVEAQKIGGPDTENINADTANKILNNVLIKYMGKEAAAQWEIKEGNRVLETEVYDKELQQRNALADNVVRLWENGQLMNKSNYEIEQLLLQNAKTREETRNIIKGMDLLEQNIKGAKLDNIIKELEVELIRETGLDRNSPAILRMVGRLFVNLFGGKGLINKALSGQ